MKNYLAKLEFSYFAILPFLAYIAILYLDVSQHNLFLLPIFGWIFLLFYQILYLGWLQKTQEDASLAVTAIIPPVLIGINQAYMNGSIWTFFIENMVLEGVTLILALILVLLFSSNHEGKNVWKESSTAIAALFFSALLLGGCWVFVTAWWEINLYQTAEISYWNIGNFVLAFIVGLRSNLLVMNDISKRKVAIKDVYAPKEASDENDTKTFFLIFGQIVLWVSIYAGYLIYQNY